jgi:hypothetical protein
VKEAYRVVENENKRIIGRMKYKERAASQDDFEFLFELKKAAEYDAVSRVFGWNEALQRQLHEQDFYLNHNVMVTTSVISSCCPSIKV